MSGLDYLLRPFGKYTYVGVECLGYLLDNVQTDVEIRKERDFHVLETLWRKKNLC